MADVRALLNPTPVKLRIVTDTPSPRSSPNMTELSSPRKKAKLTKDAPVFTPGPVQGECRFPPDEYQDEELAAHHQHFEVTPFGEIADYPRHIPYNSEKKSFMEKTNREYLEVFQYTFKVPGKDHIYTVLWDYNIGLVRTTPLFKCTGYAKTTPAKMLNRNPGLRDICHSITGGALVAQGYWIPMEAAKAIAASFCYDIRYALTPVFGHDFPSVCLKPDDEHFGDMTIDPAITQRCTERAKRFREEESISTPHISAPSSYPLTPNTPSSGHRKPGHTKKHKRLENTYTSPYNSSSYGSDAGSVPDDRYPTAASTPDPAYRNVFTPLNTPRHPPRSVPFPERRLPSPREILAGSSHRYQSFSNPPMTPASTLARCSSPEISPKTMPRQLHLDSINGQYYPPQTHSNTTEEAYDMVWLNRSIPEEQQKAAYALLSLKFSHCGEDFARVFGITLHQRGDETKRAASA